MSETDVIELPGMVDMHVHLREPGAEYKEGFASGTRAAASGGFTLVADMPNNPGEFRTNCHHEVVRKRALARGAAVCDVVVYYGSQPEDNNTGSFGHVRPLVHGLKLYLEPTTGNEDEYEAEDFREIAEQWHKTASPTQPIIVHAEERIIEPTLVMIAGEIGHHTHVAHVSTKRELQTVMDAKEKDWPVTAGVTPHHLLLDEDDVKAQGWFARMKPALGRPEDRIFLWDNLTSIDVFETDHAPHSDKEKSEANELNPEGNSSKSAVKCYGVPGLEAVLPLLLIETEGKRLEIADIVEKMSIRPREILGLPKDDKSRIFVSMERYEFGDRDLYSKATYPYMGRLVTGRVVRVDLCGQTVLNGGRFTDGKPRGEVLLPQNVST